MNTDPIVINYEDVPCTWGQQDVTVYPLNEESIDANVADGIQPANYRIGRLNGQDYEVIYVGRVDIRQDRGLKDRMIEHLGEFEGDCYFEWNEARTVLDAYRRECMDYHCWGEVGDLENEIHPRKPTGYQTICPVCGE